MAHTKSGGSTANVRDSKPKYLGVKLTAGTKAKPGAIIVRQKGAKFIAGKNVRSGRDYTLYAIASGTVQFTEKRVTHFDGSIHRRKLVTVV